ncbi:hypothetical protein [Butyrivibrio sp. INlla16]|uniref:hypothetical protein n=1 Tax=Butyrivibrio sp. INlla16 TaxID=1520807 RepID=UPI0008834BCC|nr:hypothetical protein [Butyrivibrio sp. INlla16]SDB21851.1 hypothetical protein SAMN02910263_01046 [Butyrivibrio sp. INlla16]
MPVGNPKNQTIWSQRYQEKVGYITKGYKLKKDLTDNFKEACSKSGISQAAALTQFMEAFIDTSNNSASTNTEPSSAPEYMINSEDPKLSFIIETYDNLSDDHKNSIYKYVKKYYSKKQSKRNDE